MRALSKCGSQLDSYRDKRVKPTGKPSSYKRLKHHPQEFLDPAVLDWEGAQMKLVVLRWTSATSSLAGSALRNHNMYFSSCLALARRQELILTFRAFT